MFAIIIFVYYIIGVPVAMLMCNGKYPNAKVNYLLVTGLFHPIWAVRAIYRGIISLYIAFIFKWRNG
jgi:hypothetical protein